LAETVAARVPIFINSFVFKKEEQERPLIRTQGPISQNFLRP